MPNEPKHAKEKRPPTPDRQNAQGDHEGSEHSPDEFDVMNPQKQGLGEKETDRPSSQPAVNR